MVSGPQCRDFRESIGSTRIGHRWRPHAALVRLDIMDRKKIERISKALADETRLRIFEAISSCEQMNCTELVAMRDVTPRHDFPPFEDSGRGRTNRKPPRRTVRLQQSESWRSGRLRQRTFCFGCQEKEEGMTLLQPTSNIVNAVAIPRASRTPQAIVLRRCAYARRDSTGFRRICSIGSYLRW